MLTITIKYITIMIIMVLGCYTTAVYVSAKESSYLRGGGRNLLAAAKTVYISAKESYYLRGGGGGGRRRNLLPAVADDNIINVNLNNASCNVNVTYTFPKANIIIKLDKFRYNGGDCIISSSSSSSNSNSQSSSDNNNNNPEKNPPQQEFTCTNIIGNGGPSTAEGYGSYIVVTSRSSGCYLRN
jgi:hypothetical protein